MRKILSCLLIIAFAVLAPASADGISDTIARIVDYSIIMRRELIQQIATIYSHLEEMIDDPEIDLVIRECQQLRPVKVVILKATEQLTEMQTWTEEGYCEFGKLSSGLALYSGLRYHTSRNAYPMMLFSEMLSLYDIAALQDISLPAFVVQHYDKDAFSVLTVFYNTDSDVFITKTQLIVQDGWIFNIEDQIIDIYGKNKFEYYEIVY